MLGDAVGGELRPEGEAAERAEAGGGGKTDDVEAGYRGFEVGGEDGGVVEFGHLAAEVGVNEAEALELHFVAGGGDDVIDDEVLIRAVALFEVEFDAFVCDVDLLRVGAEV